MAQWRAKKLVQAQFFLQLAALLNAGISVQRTLEMAAKTGSPALRQTMPKIIQSLDSGTDLATAIALCPGFFDRWTVNLIRTAEQSGSLALTCRQIAQDHEQKHHRDCIYFSVQLSILSMVWSTVLIIAVLLHPSANLLLQPSFWILSLGLVGSSFLAFKLMDLRRFSRQIYRQLFQIPILGQILEYRSLLGIAELALPLNAGLSVLAALDLVRPQLADPDLAPKLAIASQRIRQGRSLTDSLQGQIPTVALDLIHTGESTGDLVTMLQKLREYADSELERTLKQLQNTLRPLSLLFIGGAVLILGIQALNQLFNSLPG